MLCERITPHQAPILCRYQPRTGIYNTKLRLMESIISLVARDRHSGCITGEGLVAGQINAGTVSLTLQECGLKNTPVFLRNLFR